MAMRTRPELLEDLDERIRKDSSHLNNYIEARKRRNWGNSGTPALLRRMPMMAGERPVSE